MMGDLIGMQRIIDKALGKPKYSYQMNRNAPQPKAAFAAVKLFSSTNIGYDKREYIEDDLGFFFRTTGIRVLEFDVMFSHDSDNDADTFDSSFYRPDVLKVAQENGLALLGKRSLSNKDKVFETDWAVRTAIRVTANVIRIQDSPIEYFTAVSITGEYNEGSMVNHIGPINVGDIE